ncbi:MAG: hypothetical protein JW929_12350 [Anaerolineales bacterium]|nr:hypothetical protein [Anaerolineales bacterium]
MNTSSHIHQGRRLWILLGLMIPLFGCVTIREAIFPPTLTPTPTVTPTPTPTSTPTPTRVPLAEQDLGDLALRRSDLPDGRYVETVLPDFHEILLESGEEDTGLILENLETGYAVLFLSGTESIYMNVILVYADPASAAPVFEYYAENYSEGDEVEIPRIGDASTAVEMEMSGLYAYGIVWRYEEAIVQITYVGEDDIGIDEAVRLAQTVQGRFEAL